MTKQQTIHEIIKLAIRREEEAHNFLLAISACAESPEIKSMLESMAKEELEHKEKLELELMKLGEVVHIGQIPQGSENPYYFESEECSDMDYGDLLRLAIEKEDISFHLYMNLASQMHQQKTRDIFTALAEEELRHKLRFEDEYNNYLNQK